jgi:NAD(P)-dependent dehydrogenase (short-subunit alcohol dehydrogenase family)
MHPRFVATPVPGLLHDIDEVRAEARIGATEGSPLGEERHMELQGQVAIVTGAGRGIGRATALELARMGADIGVAELDRANADRTASEVRGLGRRALVVPTDVTSRNDLAAMVNRTRAEFGRIDILVNNAGIYRAAATLDSPRNTGTRS